MAIDRALLTAATAPAIRLYAWTPPGVSLGWFQRDVDLAPFRRAGYDVVRRVTGGGAVVHHHEVTYSVVLPAAHPRLVGKSIIESYAVIQDPIRAALRVFGIETEGRDGGAARDGAEPALCFERASPLDVLCGGRKIVGSAQRRLPDRVLQHGSIILDPNPLQPDQPSLSAIAGRTIEPAALAEELRRAFDRVFGPFDPAGLTAAEEEVAAAESSGNL